jgi:DNA-binding CsgD family transcriptional regulator
VHTRAPLLVGREREIVELSTALGGARSRHGCTVFVTGEPGIGKTRLASHAASRAAELGMRVLRGRGSAIGPMVPFRPLTEALLSVFRETALPDGQVLGPYRAVLGHLIPDWVEPAGTRANVSVVVLAEALLRLTATIGAERGSLLLLDDLQDADAETLAVVEYLVDNLERQPIVLLATIRSEPSAAYDLALRASQRGSATILELAGLSQPEVCRLAAACLGVEPGGVPPEAGEHLWHSSAGIPFVVEELLHAMVSNGQLIGGPDRWRVVGTLRTELPVALVHNLASRTDRLGPQGRALLSVAAVLGRRFPLSVVRRVTGIDNRSLLSHLHAGVAAQLVTPDDTAPDWYAFRHPLTAEALLAELAPAERADISRRAADAVQETYPGMPGEWCQLVATLRQAAGDSDEGGRLFAEAGRRALAAGAATSAVTLLERAERLLPVGSDSVLRADVLASLLPALAEAGQFDRALRLAESLDELGSADLDPPRRAELHTRLARVAYLAGRWADGNAEVAMARAVLGPDAAGEHTAPIDAIAAYLALDTPGEQRMTIAETLARRAADTAALTGQPVTACEAWQVLGLVARERDLREAKECFEQVLRLAEKHRLPIFAVYGLYRLGLNDWLSEGDTQGLNRARQHAMRVGAVTVLYIVDSVLALDAALRSDFADAADRVEQCWATVRRLRLAATCRYVLATKAVLAAHQGQRRGMDTALAEFHRWGGDTAAQQMLALGLARTFCALLEENPELARSELAEARAFEASNPTTFYLVGLHGLALLLDVLAGTADREEYETIAAASVSRMRWNRQFVHLSRAVLLGRKGLTEEAAAAMEDAQVAAAPYAMAQHLGLRLVAREAHEHGWGDPIGWLRRAEAHFQRVNVPAVASACRAQLREFGASIQQRRAGTDRVPPTLRARGVTIREYEVFELLVDRLNNKAIAARLHISPRTVEKHVASLLVKTNQRDRAALSEYAIALLTP